MQKFLHFFSHNFGVVRIFCNFAANSVMNERPKIRKSREFSKFTDMSETDEIKEWQTQSVKHKVAAVLIFRRRTLQLQ